MLTQVAQNPFWPRSILACGIGLFRPTKEATKRRTTETRNRIFAKSAALVAVPPNPGVDGMIATRKNWTILEGWN